MSYSSFTFKLPYFPPTEFVQKQSVNSSLRELTLRLSSISFDPYYKIQFDELFMSGAPQRIIICIFYSFCLSPAITELHQLDSSCQ